MHVTVALRVLQLQLIGQQVIEDAGEPI